MELKGKGNENRLALQLALSLDKITFYLPTEDKREKLP